MIITKFYRNVYAKRKGSWELPSVQRADEDCSTFWKRRGVEWVWRSEGKETVVFFEVRPNP
jgi:hypothetical protein